MNHRSQKLRLALDLGSNSIGWVLFRLDDAGLPTQVERSGVRIFSNSRNHKHIPLSVERREARGARRRRDRALQRKQIVLGTLKRYELLPDDASDRMKFANMDPYQLRHEGLSRILAPHELARVLLHLSQRRGFKSNRKDEKKEEGGKSLGEKISILHQMITESGAKTLGSYLYCSRVLKKLPTRARVDQDWYPNRALYEREFELIREAQQSSGHLPEDGWNRIKDALFFQLPLRKQQPGKCLYKTELDRAPRALPSYQRFRLLQQLANLKILEAGKVAQSLTPQERGSLLNRMLASKELKFETARKLIKKNDTCFNLEVGRNSFRASRHLFGDKTSHMLAHKDLFGKAWHGFNPQLQDQIVMRILEDDDFDTLRAFLISLDVLDDQQLSRVLKLSEDDFERGYAEFSAEVLQQLSEYLTKNPESTYDMAVKSLGYHHSDFRPDELRGRLPYYGEVLKNSVREVPGSKVEDERRFGKIANPTVHAALNQLRKIVNLLLDRYGRIDEIVVEVARDLPLGERGLRELASEVRENEKTNDKWRALLREHGQRDTYANRLRLKLWHELGETPLGRMCPYSGEVIGIQKLFSADVEVDHILPRSRTFTNHHSNLVLCKRRANQFKGDRSPFEAFSRPDSPFLYEDVLARSSQLPIAKQRKFVSDAMDSYADQPRFLERQLNDTRFIGKATCRYLMEVCPRVMTSRGKLTAFLRSEMDLNRLLSEDRKKNRNDHRHHAVDAFLIGLCEPKTLLMVERILRSNRSPESKDKLALLTGEFKMLLDNMIVSHRINHSLSSKLFTGKSYGRVKAEPEKLTVRKKANDVADPGVVVDEHIRKFMQLLQADQTLSRDDIAQRVFERFGARRVKTVEKNASAITIRHPISNPRFEKALIPSEIYRIEFWQVPGKSKLEAISFTHYEANRKQSKKPHPAARKVLTLFKGDSIRLSGSDGGDRTVVVESLKPSNNKILFQEHNISASENAVGRTITFNGFLDRKLRKVHINEIGEVLDPLHLKSNDSKSSGDSNPG